MKKIAIFGVGAQGSTIARRMDEHPNVSEIICADYDKRAAEELSKSLSKAKPLQLDASDVKNVDFKYGGCGVELSELLYNMGLLSKEPVMIKGTRIVPMDLVLKLCPPAPKYPEEIKTIIDEGVAIEEGAFLVRVEGTKDNKPVSIDCYANAPGLVESFEKSGLSHETYLTGQCGAVFVKMLVDDGFTEKGLFVPEQFDADARRYCFDELAKLDITIDESIETQPGQAGIED